MARIILTNNKNKFYSSIKNIKDSRLVNGNFISNDFFNCAVFEKRIYSLGNFWKKNDNEFIAAVGSFLYKSKTGSEALSEIFNDFSGDVNKIKKKCVGIYSFIILKNNEVYIFNDYYGICDLNYFQDKDVFFISNSLSELVKCCDSLNLNENGVITECFHTGCFSAFTPFDDVFKVTGDQYIRIIDEKFEVCIIPYSDYKYNNEFISEEQSLNELTSLLEKYSKNIANCFKDVAVNVTGGLDSRAVLASLLKGGIKPKLLYGVGNSYVAPTCLDDYNIVKQLAKNLKLPLYSMNWNDVESISGFSFKYQSRIFKDFGFCNMLYAGNENIFTEYEGLIPNYPKFMEFGYFLENLRLREWAEEKNKEYISLNEFIDEYYLNNSLLDVFPNYLEYRDHLYTIFSSIAFKQGILTEDNLISINNFERLRWNSARYSDSRMHVFINEFTYAFPIFGIPEIHELILALPANVIRSGVFQIKLVKKLDVEMIKFPLFSHRRLFKINKNNSKSKVINIKNIADSVFKVIRFIEYPLKNLYRRISFKDYSCLGKKVNEDISIFDGINIEYKNYKGDVGDMYKYRQFLIGYDFVKNNINEIN